MNFDQAKEVEKKHILIVDDDIEMLKLMRIFLSEKYNVTIVDSGKNAIEYVLKHTPDLVLLDYMMPFLDGPHVLNILRSRKESKDIPVIFLTSVKDKEKIVQCLSMNPQGYLIKPIARSELLDRVREVIGE